MPKNNVQAKHRQRPMPLAARYSFSNGSKSRSQETSQRVQVMFKAKYIYKNYAFSIFDHTTMRKKTHQNELDGRKQDGWVLALAKISLFAISSMAPKTSTFFDLKTCLKSKIPHSNYPLEGLSKQIDRLLEGYYLQILATNRNPEVHNGKVLQIASHLTWILAE